MLFRSNEKAKLTKLEQGIATAQEQLTWQNWEQMRQQQYTLAQQYEELLFKVFKAKYFYYICFINPKNHNIMPSTSEVGHAKNVANLQKLTEQVTVYTLYNPPVDNLKVANLQALYTTANTKLTEVEDKRNANKNAITIRQSAFENLKSTCTRIINLLEILGLPQGTLDQAKSLNRTIQGG